jgi:antitoxin component of MazEF toxin-antitoxin module
MFCCLKPSGSLRILKRALQAGIGREPSLALDKDTLCVYTQSMTKKLIRHGNSAALVLDKALLDLLKVKIDTPLEVTTDGKNIIISPQSVPNAEGTVLEALEKINRRHGSVLRRLGQ